jgi:hypothetical protein
MQRAVKDVDRRGAVERVRELDGHAQRVSWRRCAMLPDAKVERFGADVILDQVGGDVRGCRRPAAPTRSDASTRRQSDVRTPDELVRLAQAADRL